MSTARTAKAVLNRRIKISKSGRPYVDMADLVAMLERIGKPESRDAKAELECNAEDAPNEATNGAQNTHERKS